MNKSAACGREKKKTFITDPQTNTIYVELQSHVTYSCYDC